MPELHDNFYMLTIILGAIMPWVISLITDRSWPGEVKTIIAAAMCVLAGAAATFVAGEWSSDDITRSVLVVFFVSQIVYGTFVKPRDEQPEA